MFYYVEGRVAVLEQGLAVIDCGGVGYACHTSQNTVGALKMGKTARLYTYLYVREGAVDLFGFADQEELNCFKMLLGVSGVGPKAALAILSVAPPSQLALAIITEDAKLLTQAPGIGKKIAQRIVLELRDKMSKGQLEGAAGRAAEAIAVPAAGAVNHVQEAVAALMVLGYTQAEAFTAMEGLETAGMEAEDIIRHCLKKLAIQ
ncbi:MAG: Holliday junction branch migration protein RuvA [Butyricicoccus sp.]|nr:Holliday junction branch migration protein RuvA [Butyricicoccus sp.]